MPLYEYICKKCQHKFSEVMSVKQHDTKKVQCPKCKSTELEHLFDSVFVKTASKTGSW
jgi:putative FmdB family regulatory protein